ncbi:MAG: thiamine phosphate synthase [Proteobacteria bacterium]|nr:thiamine phosphate synthase [Pseudomonadota bacterium]
MAVPSDFGFYGILTEPMVGYERLASIMVDHGVRIIQLRMKNAPPEEIIKTGRSLKKITTGTGSSLIMNDSPELALAAQADGVHLGQNDTSYDNAREILGADAIIGLSTHSVAQARAACGLKPDYIAIGPVFSTLTKRDTDPVIGVNGLKRILEVATVPAVAIGGIDPSNISQVLGVGIRNVAAIGSVSHSKDPADSLKQIIRLIKEPYGARI